MFRFTGLVRHEDDTWCELPNIVQRDNVQQQASQNICKLRQAAL